MSVKELFDELDKQQRGVEASLGEDCVFWKRGSDIKHARIFVQDDALSINREEDWERIATYHGEWSKRIFDLLVPYVRGLCGDREIIQHESGIR